MSTKIDGRQIALDDKRAVFVGQCACGRCGDDTSYFLQFDNGSARKRIKLSAEAAVALRSLLNRDHGCGEPKSYETDAAEFQWTLVTPETPQ